MDVKEWLGKYNNLGYDIWNNKYRFNNETFDQWLDRVSGGNEELREVIKERKFLFGGRTLSNRGTKKKGSFSNCYSRGFVGDDLGDIMNANNDIAITFKAQGGQGISLSKLRPKGCGINHGQFKSDGIVPFMEIYNRTTESISQGGSRKGALILSLDAWHKEAEEFITIKSTTGRIQKANLSLEIDDEFMKCVETYYKTGEVITKTIKRTYGTNNSVEYEVTPINLYKKMMEIAYDWAEPGCIFTDRFRKFNMMEYCDDYQIETCNPCGEQPLPKHGACNLGSINLSEFVINPFTNNAYFDYDEFARVTQIGIEALDTVLDENMENHALLEQREMAKNYRNVGLGIMGLHDAMIKMGIKYGSDESFKFADSVMKNMFFNAVIKSSKLAKDYGTFPKYHSSLLDSHIIRQHFTEEELEHWEIKDFGLRNCSLLSIAPTGSLGTMLNISTGCEPLFALYYNRKTESLNGDKETYYKVYSGIVKEYVDKFGEDLPDYINCSADIDWHDRIIMQSMLQNHVDTAISSTINLPKETTVEEIEQLYLEGWKSGLKGVTIFRDGCKRTGILTHDNKDESVEELTETGEDLPRGSIVECSNDLIGKKRKLMSGCGSLHCLAYFHPETGELQEVYLGKGSTGGCNNFMIGLSRMISLACRAGVSVYDIKDQLDSTGACPSYASRSATKHDTSRGSCCPMAIGNALIAMYEEMQSELGYFPKKPVKNAPVKPTPEQAKNDDSYSICPECGEHTIREGGCISCKSCGWSKCN